MIQDTLEPKMIDLEVPNRPDELTGIHPATFPRLFNATCGVNHIQVILKSILLCKVVQLSTLIRTSGVNAPRDFLPLEVSEHVFDKGHLCASFFQLIFSEVC